MGAAALAVLLIVGVSVVAWHFTKQEQKVGAFSALEATNKGCITGCDPDNVLGVSGCSGKMIVEETFKRGDIEKVDTDGFSQHWTIKQTKRETKQERIILKSKEPVV